MRATAESLLRQFRKAGYTDRSFSLFSVGNYSVEDADWNYKDVPHLNIVHTKVRAIIGTMNDELITTINLQKVFGIAMPVTLVNYATSEKSQTYFTTLGPYILVVFTEYETVGKNQTKVTTAYNIAGPRWAMLFFPLLKRILSRNYETLMSEDLPMRDRRGQLRASGFTFKSDGRSRTFPETTDLLSENVTSPARNFLKTERIALENLLDEGSTVKVGPDDDRGVRLVRVGEDLLVLPRYCPHEGASLDCSPIENGRLTCPWHGKKTLPLGRVACIDGTSLQIGSYRVAVEADAVIVELPSDVDATLQAVASAESVREA